MPIKRIPLFGSIECRDGPALSSGATNGTRIQYDQGGTDSQFEVLTDPLTQKRFGYFYPRQNFVSSGVLNGTSSNGSAIHAWVGGNDAVVTAFGNPNSVIFSGLTTLGTMAGECHHITEGSINGTAHLFFSPGDQGTRCYYYPNGGTFTQITDVDFPGQHGVRVSGPLVQMDGYVFCMGADGNIYNSDLNSVSAWTTLGYVPTSQKKDVGYGVARYQNGLVALSGKSIEFFYNAGNATNSPLNPDGHFIPIGVVNERAFCEIGDTVAFCSQSEGSGVFLLYGAGVKKISTPPIDRAIELCDEVNIYLNKITSHGRLFLILTLFTVLSNSVLAYDMENDTWSLWRFPNGVIRDSDVIINANGFPRSVFVAYSNINSYWTGTNSGLSGEFLTAKFDNDNRKRKFINRITVLGHMTGTGTNTASVSWSDDDYETFSTARTVNLSANEKPILTRCGSFYSRAFRVAVTNDNSGHINRIAALEIDYDQGND